MNKIKNMFNTLKQKLINLKNWFINEWKKDPTNILIPIVAILIFIVASLFIGIITGIIIFGIINLIYWGYILIMKKINNKNKKIEKIKNNKNITIKPKRKKRKALKIVLLILLTLFIFAIIGIIGFVAYIVVNAPTFNEELLYLSEPTILLDKNGKEFAKIGEEKRITISYDEIPEVLIDAIIATEDSRFFEHNGVDWARFLKASALQLMGQSDAGGASTLTMQVSKNAYTDTEASGIEGIIRKFTDVYVSMFILEKNYTKEKIIEFYVNSQWLGKNSYGIEQASLTYFGKSSKELNLAEAAMIAGLFQAPGRYDPYKNPEATEARRQTVLKLMLRHEYITKEEYDIAKVMSVEKIVIPKEESAYSSSEISEYQSFIDTVVDEVKDKTGKNPYSTSMIIYTTLDTKFQDYINDIMNGVSFTWQDEKAQGGVAVINVKNGSISAIGGGRNIDAIDTYNHATEIEEQIGSTAKPLYDYGPAIEYKNWSTYTIIADEPTSYSDGTPMNNWNRTYEGFETMRVALRGSRNIPALKTFKQNNKSQIIDFVTNLGLTPEIYSCNEGYSLDGKKCINESDATDIVDAIKDTTLHEAHSIGGYTGESPLSMAAAYAAFANNGTYTEPYSFTKLIYQETNEEYTNEIKSNKAMSSETAYMISDMLVTTAPFALGGHYNVNGIKYAAKTGTTNYDSKTIQSHKLPYYAVNDLWTIGYNTEYSIGVWYGYDFIDKDYCNSVNSPQHTRLFQAVAKKIFTNKKEFTRPNSVVAVEVESGCAEAMLPSEFTPDSLKQTELFIRGTEPTATSTRFAKLKDVSNLQATTNDNIITLTWDEVETPEINTESYLKKYFSKVFSNTTYLNNHVKERLSYNKAHIGNIGYNVYIKNTDGSLKLLDYVSTNEYKTTATESGEYTFVIKTAYSIFKNNMSDGKSVSTKIEISIPIIPPVDTDNDNQENKEPEINDTQTNTNNNQNTQN